MRGGSGNPHSWRTDVPLGLHALSLQQGTSFIPPSHHSSDGESDPGSFHSAGAHIRANPPSVPYTTGGHFRQRPNQASSGHTPDHFEDPPYVPPRLPQTISPQTFHQTEHHATHTYDRSGYHDAASVSRLLLLCLPLPAHGAYRVRAICSSRNSLTTAVRRAPPNPFIQSKATTARILLHPLIIVFLVKTSIFPPIRNLLCNTPPNTHLYLVRPPANRHISTIITPLIKVITVSDSNTSVTAINRPCHRVPNSLVFSYQSFHWKTILHPKSLRILSHASAHPRRWSTPHLPRQHPHRRPCLPPTIRQVQLRTRLCPAHSRTRGALPFPMRVPTCGNNLVLLLTNQSACGPSLTLPLARSLISHTRCSSSLRSTAAILNS